MDYLTNDAKYLLSTLYKEYILRRKNKITKERAVKFDDIESVHKLYMSEWSFDDVKFTCFELYKHNLIHARPASNSLYYIRLSTEAIAMLEETFADKVDNVLEFLKKIKESIPFL